MGMFRWRIDTLAKLEYFWQEFAITVDVHLRLPPQDFRKTFFPSKDFKRLLDFPINQHKALLLLNYIPAYKSIRPDVPKKSKSPPLATSPPITSSPRPDQASTSDPAEQPSTSAPQLIPPSQCQRRRRAPLFAPVGRTRSQRHRSTETLAYDPANPPTALLAIHSGTKVTVAVAADEMGCKKAVADDLLVDIPNVVTVQSSPSQSQPKPKPKRLKKAQAKATVTQIDSEDTLSISKLAEDEKSSSAAEKRPAEDDLSKSTRLKKLRSLSITIEDKPVRTGDSVVDIEVGVALSTALLLPNDLNRMAEVSEYENFALMVQHSAIQHAHSFALQTEEMKKELVHKTKKAARLLKSLNKAKAKMKSLIDQANAAKQAQDEAEKKAGAAEAVAEVFKAENKEAEAKIAKAQAELRTALAIKDAEIKAADEKAYAERAADVREDYKTGMQQGLHP
ncbi:uncharacterized protein LOC114269498 [Camellia sinensis]|uniref:uncharacterized protein LOC114269498 n=1 Tax=Camellia sinensis TaxID=4442 RepID=UPI001036CFC2|nr:uncharacterized protein LOC114269498 [Camellia sinensis]